MSFAKPMELGVTDNKPGATYKKDIAFVVVVVLVWLVGLWIAFNSPVSLIKEYWPISIIAFFSAAVANATAVGGGFIFLPLFSFYYGLTGIEALKLALSTQAFGMTSGALGWSLKLIDWSAITVASAASAVGMVIGTYYWQPSEQTLHFYFGLVSSVIGIALLTELLVASKQQTRSFKAGCWQWPLFALLCLFGGIVNAWVSIGIGEIVALWLIFVWHRRLAQAIATGVAILAFCSILGFAFHTQLGGIPWHYLAFTSVGVVLGGRAGAYLGLRLANQKNSHGHTSDFYLKALVAVVILIDGLVVLYKS